MEKDNEIEVTLYNCFNKAMGLWVIGRFSGGCYRMEEPMSFWVDFCGDDIDKYGFQRVEDF